MFKVGDFVHSPSGNLYEITDRAGHNPFNLREILWEVVNMDGLPNAFPTSELRRANQCSANIGGDPASGCDELVGPDSDYCPRHEGY